jgi:hypothetical protein
VETPASGGRRRSPVPAHGYVYWISATTLLSVTAAFGAAAFLLVASGINH